MRKRQRGSFARGNPLRDQAMVTVGKLLMLAASPDTMDGLSDMEYRNMKQGVPGVFMAWELISRIDERSNLSLPPGFTAHFFKEVLPDIEIIRNNPEKRVAFRAAISSILNNPSELNNLYDDKGTTFSDVATIIAETNRQGEFYQAVPTLPAASAAVLPRTEAEVPSVPMGELGEAHGS